MSSTTKRGQPDSKGNAGELPLLSLARQVRSWADTLLGVVGGASDLGMTLAQARVRNPARKAAVAKAGSQLRKWREAAGMTASELSDAVGLGDSHLIEQAEGGAATLRSPWSADCKGRFPTRTSGNRSTKSATVRARLTTGIAAVKDAQRAVVEFHTQLKA